MHDTKPTAAQRNMERRMLPAEADRLASLYLANPHSSFYRSISEFTGKERCIIREDALYILGVRGYLKGAAA